MSNILFCLICFIGPYFVFIGVPEYIRVVIVLLWLILQGIRISNCFFINRKHRSISLLSKRAGPKAVRNGGMHSISPNINTCSFRLDRVKHVEEQRIACNSDFISVFDMGSFQLRPITDGEKLLHKLRRHSVQTVTLSLHQLLLLRFRVPREKQRFV